MSSDGTKIVYACIISKEQGFRAPFAIYIYDTLSKTSTNVLDSGSQTIVWGQPGALISPDGNSLLINSGNPHHLINVYLLDLRTQVIAQLTNDTNFSFQATAWGNDSQSFYLHQTLANAPYAEKNFLMSIKGEIIFPIIDIQGIITR
jgi:Tol biopolymer transport system component